MITKDHASVSADTTIKLYTVPAGRKFRLDRAQYINVTGLAEDAANWFQIAVLKGATVMATIDTDSDSAGADNSIAANTFTTLNLAADAATVAAAGDVISLLLEETGTATLPAGTIVIDGRLL